MKNTGITYTSAERSPVILPEMAKLLPPLSAEQSAALEEDLLEAKQWALDTQKGRRNLEKWELGKIALKLKPEIEAKARANQSAAGGDKFSEKPLSATLPEAVWR